jgi:hypothetical protein
VCYSDLRKVEDRGFVGLEIVLETQG